MFLCPAPCILQFIKKHLLDAVIILLFFCLVACGFNKQAMLPPDYSVDDMTSSSESAIDEDSILSAVVQMDLTTPEGSFPAKAALIVKKPFYLRLESIPLFGPPDFVLTATPETIKVFIPSKNEFYTGSSTATIRKFLPCPVELEDMIIIVTGNYPSLKEKNITYRRHQDENLLCLEMKAPSGRSQIIWRGEKNKLQKFVRRDENSNAVYTVHYIYHQEIDTFPEKIVISMSDGATSLSIRYQDVQWEKAKDLSVFDLAVPEDVKSMVLDEH